jgi:Asp-tRNA(Asn)/Glu-tRNA(Gln) amidotransferase A subunit family amidase
MGTDTCGSIRIPASHNNLVGLRVTPGLSSRQGIIPLAHTQDVAGPLARSVVDLAIMLDATVGLDPSDPITRDGVGRTPRTFVGAIGDSSLGQIRVATLTPLFGTAPEDAEVAEIVRSAITRLRELGADTTDRDVPGLQALLQNTSVINAEFKFDLLDYFAAHPNAPVHSLADILASGRYGPAIEGLLQRAELVDARTSDAYTQMLERRDAVRRAVLADMDTQGIDAFAYPTIRRQAALIGEGQGGSNCQLSATTGLPAISVPAGFTADGLPVGLELLGRPFGEAQLLRIAYAYERLVQPRRPPQSTP